MEAKLEELARQLDEKDKAILKLQSEFEDRTRWALEMEAKLEAIRQSRLYKLAKLLGLKLKA